MAHGESIHYDPDGCLAVVSSTGRQCGDSDPPLCGTHEKSRTVLRVDEFESGPNEDLRDDLVEECGITGTRAYELATLTDSIRELWRICTGLQPVEIAGEEWSGRKLRSYAPNVARHPDLDVDHHPLASDNCVAVIEDGAFGDEYRCTTSGHGRLLCGVHQDNQGLRTIFDEDFEGYDCPIVWVNGEKCRLLEQRGDDVIVATVGDWSLERFEDPDLGQVSVSIGSDVDEVNDGDMGEVDEDAGNMGEDGDRDVDELTEPEPPEPLPKYLVEGVQKQDVDTLRDLIDFAEGMIDYQEAVAERELEEQAADEEPDEWDEDEWQEKKEEALEKAGIFATKATLTIKEIDDNRYYYYQWREGGKTKSQYIAPVSPSE